MVKVELGGKHGTAAGRYALVDNKDYELVSQHIWHVSTSRSSNAVFYYAQTNIKVGGVFKMLKMHRLLMPTVPLIDHKDGDGLNNQRANLRAATLSQNAYNRKSYKKGTSKYKGVSLQRGKWSADIWIQGAHVFLGFFEVEEDAAREYDYHARKVYGEFAALNFPLPGERSAWEEPK